MSKVRRILARAIRATVESLEQRCLLAVVASRHFSYEDHSQSIDVTLSEGSADALLQSNAFHLYQLARGNTHDAQANPIVPVNIIGTKTGTGDQNVQFVPVVTSPAPAILKDGWYQTYIDGETRTDEQDADTFSFLAGDLDRDGGVSINDFNIFAAHYGQTGSDITYRDGDLDYDGGVSINDFNLMAGNFGQTLPNLPNLAGSVVVANTTAEQLDVGWTASGSATDRDGFRIYRSTDGNNFVQVAEIADPLAQSWPDTSSAANPLVISQRYWYRVRPFSNLSGAGATLGKGSGVVTDPVSPPRNLLAATAGANALTLTWSPPLAGGNDDVAGYKIYRSTAPFFSATAETLVGTVNADTLEYTDRGLAAGKQYFYTIVATGLRGGSSLQLVPTGATVLPASTPTLHISGPTTAQVGNVEAFVAYGTATNSLTWTVTLNGNPVQTGSGVDFSCTPTTPGKYTITASGRDATNHLATDTLRLSVIKLMPTVTIKGPPVGIQGRALVFNGVVEGGAASQNLPSYQWLLLDSTGSKLNVPVQPSGTPSSDFIVAGIFDPGSYQVQLSVSADGGSVQQTFAFDILADPNGGDVDFGMLPKLGQKQPDFDDQSQKGPIVSLDATTVQADGKIIVAGHAVRDVIGFDGSTSARSFIARFNSDLTLDDTFGSDGSGVITYGVVPGSTSPDPETHHVWAMMINPVTGALVTVGDAYLPDEQKPRSLEIIAYLTSPAIVNGKMVRAGSLDPSFNAGQPFVMSDKVTEDAAKGTASVGYSVALANDPADPGSFYVGGAAAVRQQFLVEVPAGNVHSDYELLTQNLLVKVDSDGQALDSDFGIGGIAAQPPDDAATEYPPFGVDNPSLGTLADERHYFFHSELNYGGIRSLFVYADGDVLAAGHAPDAGFTDVGPFQGEIVKYQGVNPTSILSGTAGAADSAFGDDGVARLTSQDVQHVTTPVYNDDLMVSAIRVLPGGEGEGGSDEDGPIALAGAYRDRTSNKYCVFTAKLTPSGNLDLNYNHAESSAVITRPDLPLYVDGHTAYGGEDHILALYSNTASVLIEEDGTVDAALNTTGLPASFPGTNVGWLVAQIGLDGNTIYKKQIDQATPNPDNVFNEKWLLRPYEHNSAAFLTPDGLIMMGSFRTISGDENSGWPTTEYPGLIRYKSSAIGIDGVGSRPKAGSVRVAIGNDSAPHITWKSEGYGQDGFFVRRSTQTGPTGSTVIGVVGPDQYDFVDHTAGADTTYSYFVVPFYSDASHTIVPANPSSTDTVRTFPTSQSGFALQEVVTVPVDGATVNTQSNLAANQTYLLVASGSFHLDSEHVGDAAGWWSTTQMRVGGDVFAGQRFGVSIADRIAAGAPSTPVVPSWSAVDLSDHRFITARVGTGHQLNLRYDAAIHPPAPTPGAPNDYPIQVAIYGRPRQAVPATPSPSTAPFNLSVSIPGADLGATPRIISVDRPVTVSATDADGEPAAWTLSLVDPTGVSETIIGTSDDTVSPQLNATALKDGVYTLKLQVVSPDSNEHPVLQVPVAIEKPVLRVELPVVTANGINSVISRNTPVKILAASPDGKATPWKLWLTSRSSVAKLIASGTGSAGALPGETEQVATLIPAMYRNGDYRLELSTNFASAETDTTVIRSVTIATAVKTGTLSLPSVDGKFKSPSGLIDIARTYDSGDVSRFSDPGIDPDKVLPNFGPGWSLDLLDSHLSTTFQADTYKPNQSTDALRAGDILTLKVGGVQHTFEFAPVPISVNARTMASNQSLLYEPRFIALDGSGATLMVPALQKEGSGNTADWKDSREVFHLVYDRLSAEFISVDSDDFWSHNPRKFPIGYAIDTAFNPENELFNLFDSSRHPTEKLNYTLTESNGRAFVIDPASGRIVKTTDANNNTTTYSKDGNRITAEDADGRLLMTIDTDGNRVTQIGVPGQQPIQYHYESGHLASATGQAGTVTSYGYQSPGQPHLLTRISDGQGIPKLQALYDDTGHLTTLFNAKGKAMPVSTAALGPNQVSQTVVDAKGNVTQDVFDEAHGTLVRKIQRVPDSSPAGFHNVVTVTDYDYVTNNIAVMSDLRPSGVQVLRSIRSYLPFEVAGQNVELSFSQSPDANGWTKRVAYDNSEQTEPGFFGLIQSTSERIAEHTLLTTRYDDYKIVNTDGGVAKAQKITVSRQVERGAPEFGFDTTVKSTHYMTFTNSTDGYSSASGKVLFELTPVARDLLDVPGGDYGDGTLDGGYPTAQYLRFDSGFTYVNGTQRLPWSQQSQSYVWTYQGGSSINTLFSIIDTDAVSRGASAKPLQGDKWTLHFTESNDTTGISRSGTREGLSFDGTPGQLDVAVRTFLTKGSFISSESSGSTIGDSSLRLTVPGWLAEGTRNVYTAPSIYGHEVIVPLGMIEESYRITGIIAADGKMPTRVEDTLDVARTVKNSYYGKNDYDHSALNVWTPDGGSYYGAIRNSRDAAGQETVYGYDKAGLLVLQYTYKKWTDDTGAAAYGWVGTRNVYDAGRLHQTYEATYQSISGDSSSTNMAADHVLAMENTAGTPHVVIDATTVVYSAERLRKQTDYNAQGRVSQKLDEYGRSTAYTYDVSGNVVETTNADGTKSRTIYDELNRPVWQTGDFVPGTGGINPGPSTKTTYDALGNAVLKEVFTGTIIQVSRVGDIGTASLIAAGTKVSSTQTYYDDASRPIETVDPSGLHTGTTYTPDGKVEYTGPLAADANGHYPDGGHIVVVNGVTAHAFTFADFDHPSRSQAMLYDPGLGLFYSRMTDRNNHATDTYVDAEDRPVRTVYADGTYSETLYSYGRDAVQKDHEGHDIADSNPYNSIQWGADGQSETVQIARRSPDDAPVITVNMTDRAGRLTDVYLPKVVDANPKHDGANGEPSTFNVGVVPHWRYAYDTAGNEVAQVSPQQQAAYSAWLASGGQRYVEATYDQEGNEITPGHYEPVPLTGVTTFAYDPNGQQVRQTLPEDEIQTWTYDDHHRVTTHADFNGNVATYTYEPATLTQNGVTAPNPKAGLLDQVLYAAAPGSGKAGQTVAYTYDDHNRRQTVADASGTTTYGYDAFGNLNEAATPEGTVHYGFDPATQRHTGTWTDHTAVAYGYDPQGRLNTVTANKLNGQTLATSAVTSYEYYDNGNKKTETLPNGIVSTYEYDAADRLEHLTEKKGTTTLFEQAYTLNPDGTRKDSDQSQRQPDGSTVATHTDWTYDADSRLTGEAVTSSASGQGYADTFEYDLDNNRMHKVHTGPGGGASETTSYSYNSDDELKTQTSSLAGTTVNEYDPNGSLTSSTPNGQTASATTYTYDVRNKMVGFAGNNKTAGYVYDDAGNRVGESTNGVTTLYLTDTQNPTGFAKPVEQRPSITTLPNITYLLGDRVVGQADTAGTIDYLLVDGDGSTRALTDVNGIVLPSQTFGYDAFGLPLTEISTATTDWLYGGDGVHDRASDLTYHLARWRDGFRFTQADTFAGPPAVPASLHHYNYAENDPFSGYDPSGHALLGLDSLEQSISTYESVTAGLANAAPHVRDADYVNYFNAAYNATLVSSTIYYSGGTTATAGAASNALYAIGNAAAAAFKKIDGAYGFGGFGLQTWLGGFEIGIGGYLGRGGASVGIEGYVYGGGTTGKPFIGYGGFAYLGSVGHGQVSGYNFGPISIEFFYDVHNDETYIGVSGGEGIVWGGGLAIQGKFGF